MQSTLRIDSPTNFRQHTSELVEQIKTTRLPLLLTIDGRAELVVQDAASYHELLDRAERLETVVALKKAIREVDEGRTRPANEAIDDIRRRSILSGTGGP